MPPASRWLPHWLKQLLAILGTGALMLVVAGWIAGRTLARYSTGSRCTESRFTAERWRDTVAAQAPSYARGCMVDDLLDREILRGRTRAEVVALLGEPPKTDYFRDYDLVYWLGPERGLIGIDSEWLVMRLDTSGRVHDVRLVTD